MKNQEPKLDNTGRKRAACKSKSAPSSLHMKPLTGRIFYLDLPCNKRSQSLENDIISLGGTVEKFFSKDIRYLVSSRPEARHVRQLIPDSPVPSPDSGVSSPHPASRRDSHGHRGSSQGAADTVVVSRGKSLVEKVVKEQERIHMNRILANALEWGVKILHIDDVISYIDKKKSQFAQLNTTRHTAKKATNMEPKGKTSVQKCSGGRISRPFVKVEDSSRHYRPLYLHMANMPVCNFSSAAPCSPFLAEEHDSPEKKHARVQGSLDHGAKNRKDRRKGQEGRNRRKGGYCECCQVKFDSLKAHLQGVQHQAFSKSEEYLVVDQVISGLNCDLMHSDTPKKRVKSSVTSPLLVPGALVPRDGEDAVVGGAEEEEEVTEEYSMRSPRIPQCNSEKPPAARKRCRESSHNPGEQTGAAEKSRSKRGSFQLESSSNAGLPNTLGTSVSSTRQHCFSDSVERNRGTLQVCSKLQNSPSSQLPKQRGRSLELVSSKQKLQSVHQTLGVRKISGTNVASDSSGLSHLIVETVQKPLSDRTEHRTFQPPSREDEAVGVDSPPKTFLRKVRDVRSRRKVPERSSQRLSVQRVESLTPKPLGKTSELLEFSTSAIDLWQLFQSSNNTEDDFLGF